MLKGSRIGIRPLQTDDAWILLKWFNDVSVTRPLGIRDWKPSLSLEEESLILAKKLSSMDQRSFMVWNLVKDAPLGMAELVDIDLRNGNAMLFVMIGEKEDDENGIEVVELMLRIAFDNLNLHRVTARVSSSDRETMDLLTRTGFEKEGTIREDHFQAGRYLDTHIMGCLRGKRGGSC
jgi:RimJ/RimL family protein N-acetyltransferase